MRERQQRNGLRNLVLACGCGTLAVLGTAEPAAAQSANANLGVSAAVVKKCTIAANAVAFGNYDPVVTNSAAPLDANGSLDIACTRGHAPLVELNDGANDNAGQRRLKLGTNFLKYDLYTDIAGGSRWGTGVTGATLSAAPSKAPRNFIVYGRVVAGEDVDAGAYTDTIVATVNF